MGKQKPHRRPAVGLSNSVESNQNPTATHRSSSVLRSRRFSFSVTRFVYRILAVRSNSFLDQVADAIKQISRLANAALADVLETLHTRRDGFFGGFYHAGEQRLHD